MFLNEHKTMKVKSESEKILNVLQSFEIFKEEFQGFQKLKNCKNLRTFFSELNQSNHFKTFLKIKIHNGSS